MPTRINDRHPSFGINVKKLREQYNLSQSELAKAVGVKSDYGAAVVGAWELGKREPSLNTVCKIADYFGVSTDCLLGRTPSEIQDNVESLILKSEGKITEKEKTLLLNIIKLFIER